jgi:hypothetical protein
VPCRVQPFTGTSKQSSTVENETLRISCGGRLLKFKAHASSQSTCSCQWREDTIASWQLTDGGQRVFRSKQEVSIFF